MAYLAVDKDGTEMIYEEKPFKGNKCGVWLPDDDDMDGCIALPKGSIMKLIGKELTWDDEPFKLI